MEAPFLANYWREMGQEMWVKAEIVLDAEAKRIMLEIIKCYEEMARHLESIEPLRQKSDVQAA